MSNEMEPQQGNGLRTGTKVSLMVSAAFLAAAVYYFTLPTHFTGHDGGVFGCGSPMSPNNNALGKSQCHVIENLGLHKAILFLALALLSAVLGFLLFGTHKSGGRGLGRARLDDEDVDDDDLDDEDEPRSRFLAGRSARDERERPARKARERRPRLGDEDDEFADDLEEEDTPRRSRGATRDVRVTSTSAREARRRRRDESDDDDAALRD